MSAQSPGEQQEAADRLRLAFPLLSDAGGEFGKALRLPTFEVEGNTFYKGLTLIARRGQIAKVFYPVFPPDENAATVLEWIRAH